MDGTSQRPRECVAAYGVRSAGVAGYLLRRGSGRKHAEICLQFITLMNRTLFGDDIHGAH
jgi:hypothetical protein